MSKEKHASTKCPCTEYLGITIKKPTSITPSTSKVECQNCGTKFLVHCTKDGDEFKISFNILEISAYAKAILKWKLDNPEKLVKLKEIPWHKRLIFNLLGRIIGIPI